MNNNLNEFGQFIKSKRLERGLTITELAESVGYSNPYISQLESAKLSKYPTPEFLDHLAKGLNIEYSTLLGQAGYTKLAKGQRYYEKMTNFFKDVLRKNLSNPKIFRDYLSSLNKRFNKSTKDYFDAGLSTDQIGEIFFDFKPEVFESYLDVNSLDVITTVFEDSIPTIYEEFLDSSKVYSNTGNKHSDNSVTKELFTKDELSNISKENIYFTESIRNNNNSYYIPINDSNIYDLSRILKQNERSVLFRNRFMKETEKKFIFKFIQLYLNYILDDDVQ